MILFLNTGLSDSTLEAFVNASTDKEAEKELLRARQGGRETVQTRPRTAGAKPACKQDSEPRRAPGQGRVAVTPPSHASEVPRDGPSADKTRDPGAGRSMGVEATADETAETKRRQGVMDDVMQQLQHEQQQYLEAESRRLESIRQLRAEKNAVLERISHATKIHPGLHSEMSVDVMHSPSPGETAPQSSPEAVAALHTPEPGLTPRTTEVSCHANATDSYYDTLFYQSICRCTSPTCEVLITQTWAGEAVEGGSAAAAARTEGEDGRASARARVQAGGGGCRARPRGAAAA